MPRRAASQFLSQYPAEAEVLFGPLTGLEAVNEGYICGTIRHFTIRPTVNQRAVSYDVAHAACKCSALIGLNVMNCLVRVTDLCARNEVTLYQ